MKPPSALARRLGKVEIRVDELRLDRQSEGDFLADVEATWNTLTPAQRALYKGIGKRIEARRAKEDARREAWLYSPDFEQFATPGMKAWRDSGPKSREVAATLSDAELALLEEIAGRAGHETGGA